MKLLELQKELFKLFEEGKYNDALKLAKTIEEISADMKYKTLFWRACLYCALQEPSSAINELNIGLNEGIWWNPNTLLNDPDLKPLQEIEGFKRVLIQCESKLNEISAITKPESLILTPYGKMNNQIPLIYSLHWRGDNIKRFSQYWDIKELRDDHVFAFPQSSQVHGYNEYCWDNNGVAKAEAVSSLGKVVSDMNIEKNDVILAGASQGGTLALELALENENIPNIKGFIIVVPSLREIAKYEQLIDKAKDRGLKGYMITGDKDYFYASVTDLHNLFLKKGFPCELFVKQGMGHFFPDNFQTILPQAIRSILGAT
jgi:predicted esterase